MSMWSRVKRLFVVDDTIMDEEFSLIPDQPNEMLGGDDHDKRESSDTERHKKQEQMKQAPKQESKQEPEEESDPSEPPPDDLAEKASNSRRSASKKGRRRPLTKPKKLPSKRAQDEEEPVEESGEEEQREAPFAAEQQGKRPRRQFNRLLRRVDVEPPQQSDDDSWSESNLDTETESDKHPERLSRDLTDNRQCLEKIFHVPLNKDITIRTFTISFERPVRAFLTYMEGLADQKLINSYILEPLMILSEVAPKHDVNDRMSLIRERLIPSNQVLKAAKWDNVKDAVLTGATVLFVEGLDEVMIIATTGFEHRAVGDTKVETVIRGPHDSFTENLRTNTGLVRSRLRTEKLVTEMMQLGELAPTDVAIMYVEGVTNPKLVQEVRKRIQAIKVDFIQDTGTLEQIIEDPPKTLHPKMLSTERPDKVAVSLIEGFVAIFVGQSSQVLIGPTFFWSLLHTAEDAYVRYPFGVLLRGFRFLAFMTALLLPALFLAVTNFHPEMIPTDLLLSIAAAREKVPFPNVVEVLLMEIAIELIREAGIRIPNVIGPTIGIVGALILGQAAVQAGIVSPLLVIVVAVTALASFTLPNYNFSFAVRILRFVYIIAASMWGFYGITLMFLAMLMDWSTMKSFGVPMMSPVSPYRLSSIDAIFRGPAFRQEYRPQALWPQKLRRQVQINRPWDPTIHDSEEARDADSRQEEIYNQIIEDEERAVKRESMSLKKGGKPGD